jgi:CheY-like chemotaxis protein
MALAERYPGVIHLLLTDIIMPLMDGRTLAAKLRSVRPDIEVLFVSGYSEEKLGSSRSLEADLPHLSKPFTPEVLAARVRQILADGGNRRQSASSL